MKLPRLLFALVALAAVSACASPMQVAEVQSVKAAATPTEGTAFTKGLFDGYQQRARHEAEVEFEWNHAAIFARKATRAATGEMVAPEELSQWELPEAALPVLTDARARLTGHFAEGARERVPDLSAKAQVAFDCWVEEEWEHDTDTQCRDEFLALVDQLKVPAVVEAVAPVPPASFVVMFDFDQAEIKAGAMQTLWDVTRQAKTSKPKLVRIHGHSDAVGGKRYNQKLSDKRAKAVAEQLTKLGFAADQIEIKGYGKDKPAVAVKGREEKNRRVTIELVFESAAVSSGSPVEIVPADAASLPASPTPTGFADLYCPPTGPPPSV